MAPLLQEPCAEARIRSAASSAPCAPRSEKWVLVATILGSSMAFIDGTVVNVSLPALQSNLNATVVGVQWVVEAYSLPLAAFLLVGGALGDRYGRRRIFALGVALFALASVAAGCAGTIGQLIAARAAQGLGAALLVPGSLAIISSAFRKEERGRAIGTWSGFSAITGAIGPVLGGWLIEQFSWRAVFFINLPLAALVLLILFRHVPESSSAMRGPLDWLGALVAASGLGALVYGLTESSRLGFAHPSIVIALVAAVVLLAALLLIERRVRAPMVPLDIFRSRTFTGANLLTFLLYSALGGMMFFLPLNLIQVQRYTPTQAGGALLPFILIMFLCSRWSGGLVPRYGARLPLVIGPIIAALGFAAFMLPGIGGSYWTTFFPAIAVLGIGMAVSVAPLTTTVMNSIGDSRAGVASGINNAIARAAGLLAIAVFGILMLHGFRHALEARLPELNLEPALAASVRAETDKLAGVQLSTSIPPETRAALRDAIDHSFVTAFRRVMLVASVSALAAAGAGWWLIETKARSAG